MSRSPSVWGQAELALRLLSVDPTGLGGIWLRSRTGVARDRFIAALGPGLAPRKMVRLHPSVSDDQLFGGLDLAATLNAGTTVKQNGLLAEDNSFLVLTMAERAEVTLAARLSQNLDLGQHSLIALDEGVEDEALHPAIAQRLAFHLDFSGLTHRDIGNLAIRSDQIEAAKGRLVAVRIRADLIKEITLLAIRLGIHDLRAPIFALRAARAHAALEGRKALIEKDVVIATSLVFGPRAFLDPIEPLPPRAEEDCNLDAEATENKEQALKPPEDLLLEAMVATLPENLLDQLKSRAKARKAGTSSGSGERRKGNRRGRPKPSMRGQLGGANRLDLVATLRAAAPWQAIRRSAKYALDRKVHIRSTDIRLKKFEDRSDRLLIFVVDASGSAALARLAEAKGAVELLLAEAYARRDHVALIAFRGESADILLPPTRSLVQTKRRLAGLPGGGGTPLAAGLEAAMELAQLNRTKGLTPTIALLTDGRANIALNGDCSRIEAASDATAMARRIRDHQTPAIVIDTGMRQQTSLQNLAQDLDAVYLPLPRADAHKVSQAIETTLG